MSIVQLPLATDLGPLLPHWIEIAVAAVFVVILTVLIAKRVIPRFVETSAARTAAILGGL
jgi:uncharacterized membrane protein